MSVKVRSRVKLNRQRINEIDKAAKLSLEQTAEATRTELISKQYMPFDNGTLQKENTFVDSSNINKGVVSLVSSNPYARRLYFHPEFDFQTVNNSNAQAYWFDPFISGEEKEFITNAFKKLFKKNGGF